MEILRYLAIGLAVGLLSGALGIGGGVLLVPLLMWVCGLSLGAAAGTTLAVLVVPVVLPAAWEYYARGNVDVRAAIFIALAFGFGGYAGAWLRHEHILPEGALRLGFGLMMMYIAFNMIVVSNSEVANAAVGVTATMAAWLTWLWLRMLGKRAAARPKLQDYIVDSVEHHKGETDYHI
jgi:uncharacterized protein